MQWENDKCRLPHGENLCGSTSTVQPPCVPLNLSPPVPYLQLFRQDINRASMFTSKQVTDLLRQVFYIPAFTVYRSFLFHIYRTVYRSFPFHLSVCSWPLNSASLASLTPGLMAVHLPGGWRKSCGGYQMWTTLSTPHTWSQTTTTP